MPRREPLYDWTRRVATAFPELRSAHARAMAEWSFAMVLAQAATLSAVALQLACRMDGRSRSRR